MFPSIYYLCPPSTTPPPSPRHRSLSVAVRKHWSSFFFSSCIFSPMWRLGRKLLAYQKCPRAMLAMRANTGSSVYFSSGSSEWDDEILALPILNSQKTQTQCSLLRFALQCQGRVQLKLNFAFICVTLLLFPVLLDPLESLQKRGPTGPRPDLEISGFPGQITY